ncbi:chlorophyll synthesis pathway protein BchC [Cladophialophora bantiana CBS 173.52]|uniref:Chlorophyll synthesis pathway protein BchC n=1 Tax=Cladophialophora bantiana (strain ATCC 10958 / CBS 173.52 / CDC B-1940 / NIH 8579) TaxID=1442370 RepID=A0A0D2IGD0_CLAB1|nr:chlorophyll synthesis pathway protein BchC [Cladophialophora bantiana CBS 173.52]KIW95804.1 chlorophyll synthesis pathway protein BchC [Cladophialophora bantiana CBS 173.52]
MKAYQWDGPGSGLILRDLPIPQPGADEVQIQIKACGLCHSDCHILDGTGSQWVKNRPITLGHEISAQITALGKDVTEFHVGQRVGVALIAPATAIGLDFNGGYAEYAVTPKHTIVPLPDSLSYEKACIAVDAMASAYHAVVGTGEVTSSMTVGVLGLGGLGSTGLRVACLQGATVYGFDINQEKFAAAYEAGAKACYKSIDEVKDVTFDIVFDFVGLNATMLAAINAVKREGRIVLVGMGESDMKLPAGLIVMKNIEIRGSLGGRKEELSAIFDLIAQGKLTPQVEEVPFGSLVESLHRLEQGKANARLFVRPNA